LDKNEAKYVSNLSAVLFELGQYRECLEAIKRAWERMPDGASLDPGDAMAIKVATRFARSAYHDASLTSELDEAGDISRYVDQHPGGDEPKLQEMKRWWEAAREAGSLRKAPVEEGLRRARSTPVFKPTT
jgi:hypothetical protein